ncbi:MAG TPA: M48 family metalloprotease [Thermoanaerobaculia bacterium]|jgi:Zn-dependent protease with chaperone function|nr:M48 family metalloprotease [Thermoanaerobaculia bacterium]
MAAPGAEVRQRIVAGFRGTVPPLKPSFAYRLALVGAAVTMLLMPVVYAALVGGLVWGIWVYLTGINLVAASAEVGLVLLPLWLLPPALGIVVVICLVKPLFVRTRRREAGLRLDPAREPLVFELVAQVCRALQAPVPKEILVDCEVNAAASFPRGLRSLLAGEMVLRIGLPVAKGLTLQQLAGVIAHEMGHFSQKAGLRLSMLVRMMNAWLVRLVYQRDSFDRLIESGGRHSKALAARVVVEFTRFLIWLSRKILWSAMLAGHMVSSFVMKHLEYDADRYEVRLAGFSSFDVAMREMFAMGVAHGMAIEDLQEQWKEKRLVDNLPRLVMANRQKEVRQIAAALETHLSIEQEEIFATHPTARQRIAQAMREKGVGVFSSDLPASALFADLPGLEREASIAYYRAVLGNEVRPADLVPVQALRDRQHQDAEERSALARFFQNDNPLRAVPLPARLPAMEDRAAGIRNLEEARHAVAERSADHASAIAEHHKAVKARFSALQAEALLKVGFTIDPKPFLLTDGDRKTAVRAAEQAKEKMGELGPVLAEHERIEVRRLEAALALFQLPEIAAKLPAVTAAPGEVERLLACGAFLAGRFPRLLVLRESWAVLEALASQLRPEKELPPDLIPEIRLRLAVFREEIKDVHRALRAQVYPFDHGRQETTLAQYIIPSMPADDDLGGLITMADGALARAAEIESRLLGRLAWIAEKVEDALGLRPLGRSVNDAPPAALAAVTAGVEAPRPESKRVAESKADAVESRELFLRYFRTPLDLRTIPLPDQAPEPPGDPQAAIEILWAALLSLNKEWKEGAQRVQQYRGAEQRWVRAIQAEELLNAGITLEKAEDFGLLAGDLANATRVRDRSLAQMESLEPALARIEEMQGQRLTHALALLGEPQVQERMGGANGHSDVAPLFTAAVGLHRSYPALRELRRNQWLLGILMAQGPAAQARLRERLAERNKEAHQQLRRLQRDLHIERYPFDHPGESCDTLAQRMIPRFPEASDYAGTFTAMNHAIREAADLQRRTLGRLAGMAERVERALGLGLG